MTRSVGAGFASLRANPLRTALSTLGVVIGVAALVAVLALGDGLERFGRLQISSGTDLQTLFVAPQTTQVVDNQEVPRLDYLAFTWADAESLAGRLGDRARVTILSRSRDIVQRDPSSPPHAAIIVRTVPSVRDAAHSLDDARRQIIGEVVVSPMCPDGLERESCDNPGAMNRRASRARPCQRSVLVLPVSRLRA